MSKKTANRVELTHTQLVVVAAVAAGLLLGSVKLLDQQTVKAEEPAPSIAVPVIVRASSEAPDFGPVDPKLLVSKHTSAPGVEIKLPDYRTSLGLIPQLAIASTRKHRVVEFEFTYLLNEIPKTREHEAIRVNKPFGGSVERRLEKTYEFLLADELEARQVDGKSVSAEDLLDLLVEGKPVVVIHTGTTLPSHFTQPLASDTLVVSIPREQKVWVSAWDLEPKPKKRRRSGKSRCMPIATYPELCTATAHELGVVELTSKHFDYSGELGRDTPTASLTTKDGLQDVALKVHLHSVLSTELAAYRPDGTQLSRDELLYALKEKRGVLATLAPVQPPAEYLSLLNDDAIVLHVPHEQAIDLVPENDSKSALADGQIPSRYYAPF